MDYCLVWITDNNCINKASIGSSNSGPTKSASLEKRPSTRIAKLAFCHITTLSVVRLAYTETGDTNFLFNIVRESYNTGVSCSFAEVFTTPERLTKIPAAAISRMSEEPP